MSAFPPGTSLGFALSFSPACVDTQTPAPTPGPVFPSKQMFSGHLSGFVGWAALWILVFPDLSPAIPQYLSSLLFSRCFSSFFGSPLFTILSRELA